MSNVPTQTHRTLTVKVAPHVYDITNLPAVLTRVGSRSGSYLGPLPDGPTAEPAGARGHQLVHQAEQEAHGLTAALRAAHPGDLVPADAPAVDPRRGARQPAVLQLPGSVHLLHLVQHGAASHIPQETVNVVESMRQQGRNDLLQRQMLQVCVRQRLDERHVSVRDDAGPRPG